MTQTVLIVSLELRSGLGLEAEDSLFESNKTTPTSFCGGPVTEAGGQKALKPSIFVLSAIEYEVSVSERTATDMECFSRRIRICSNLP